MEKIHKMDPSIDLEKELEKTGKALRAKSGFPETPKDAKAPSEIEMASLPFREKPLVKTKKEAHVRGPIGAQMDADDDAGFPNMIIDLGVHRAGRLDESWLLMFSSAVRTLMGGLLGDFAVPVKVKGTPSEVKAFSGALAREKRYLKDISKYGLDNPKTYKSKGILDKAVSKFDRATGLKWPFR
jgi:hypothetical protein